MEVSPADASYRTFSMMAQAVVSILMGNVGENLTNVTKGITDVINERRIAGNVGDRGLVGGREAPRPVVTGPNNVQQPPASDPIQEEAVQGSIYFRTTSGKRCCSDNRGTQTSFRHRCTCVWFWTTVHLSSTGATEITVHFWRFAFSCSSISD